MPAVLEGQTIRDHSLDDDRFPGSLMLPLFCSFPFPELLKSRGAQLRKYDARC
jgi:hypothetical protein